MTRGSQDPAPRARPGGQALARRAPRGPGAGRRPGAPAPPTAGGWSGGAEPCARHMGASDGGGGSGRRRFSGAQPGPLPLPSPLVHFLAARPPWRPARATALTAAPRGERGEGGGGQAEAPGLLATIWLTFYNIASDRGVRAPRGPPAPPRPRTFARSARWRSVPGSREGRRGAGCACARG